MQCIPLFRPVDLGPRLVRFQKVSTIRANEMFLKLTLQLADEKFKCRLYILPSIVVRVVEADVYRSWTCADWSFVDERSRE